MSIRTFVHMFWMQYIDVHLRLWCDTRYSRQIMRPDMVMRPLTGAVGNSLRTMNDEGESSPNGQKAKKFRWIGRFHPDMLVLANKNRDIKSTMWPCNGIGYTRIIQRLNWLMGIFFLPKFAEMMFILPGNQGRGLGIIILLLLSFVP